MRVSGAELEVLEVPNRLAFDPRKKPDPNLFKTEKGAYNECISPK